MTQATKVLNWKRIKMTAISDCFKNANYFHNMFLYECKQLVIDRFLNENKDVSSIYSSRNYSVDTFFVSITIAYIDYLSKSLHNSSDKGIMILYSFILISRFYWKYYKVMRTGNRIAKENIMCDWIWVFTCLEREIMLKLV